MLEVDILIVELQFVDFSLSLSIVVLCLFFCKCLQCLIRIRVDWKYSPWIKSNVEEPFIAVKKYSHHHHENVSETEVILLSQQVFRPCPLKVNCFQKLLRLQFSLFLSVLEVCNLLDFCKLAIKILLAGVGHRFSAPAIGTSAPVGARAAARKQQQGGGCDQPFRRGRGLGSTRDEDLYQLSIRIWSNSLD